MSGGGDGAAASWLAAVASWQESAAAAKSRALMPSSVAPEATEEAVTEEASIDGPVGERSAGERSTGAGATSGGATGEGAPCGGAGGGTGGDAGSAVPPLAAGPALISTRAAEIDQLLHRSRRRPSRHHPSRRRPSRRPCLAVHHRHCRHRRAQANDNFSVLHLTSTDQSSAACRLNESGKLSDQQLADRGLDCAALARTSLEGKRAERAERGEGAGQIGFVGRRSPRGAAAGPNWFGGGGEGGAEPPSGGACPPTHGRRCTAVLQRVRSAGCFKTKKLCGVRFGQLHDANYTTSFFSTKI